LPVAVVRVTVEQGGNINQRKGHASTLAEFMQPGC
jgi:hypothetical protein